MSFVINEDLERLQWVAGTPLWTSASEFTIAAWVKITTAQWADLFTLTDNGDEAYSLACLRAASGTDGDHQINIQAGTTRMSSGGSITANTWTLIAVTFTQSGNLVAYRNATAAETVGASSNPWANGQGADTIYIGYANFASYGQHSGRLKIAHCTVWNKALTAGEITSLYSGGGGGGGVNPTTVQAANLKFYAALDADSTVHTGGMSLTYAGGGAESYDSGDNPTVDAVGGGSSSVPPQNTQFGISQAAGRASFY